MSNRKLNVLFCEDIRHEVGGKPSYMGVYHTEMIYPSFPTVMPKLCAVLTIVFHPDEAPKESLTVRILKDDEVIGEAILGAVAYQPPAEIPEYVLKTDTQDRRMQTTVVLEFPNLFFDKDCQLRTRVVFDSDEIKGNGLRVRTPRPEENVQFPSIPSFRPEMKIPAEDQK